MFCSQLGSRSIPQIGWMGKRRRKRSDTHTHTHARAHTQPLCPSQMPQQQRRHKHTHCACLPFAVSPFSTSTPSSREPFGLQLTSFLFLPFLPPSPFHSGASHSSPAFFEPRLAKARLKSQRKHNNALNRAIFPRRSRAKSRRGHGGVLWKRWR